MSTARALDDRSSLAAPSAVSEASRGPGRAVLYRMVTEEHVCPYGLKSKARLEREGFTVDDRWLENREQTDAFKQLHGVQTTPQTWIDGRRIGGHDDLREHFGDEVRDEGEASYQPVIAIFAVAALLALGAAWVATGEILSLRSLEWFVAFSMGILAIQKLQDLESFSTMFLNYDLLARRWVRYGYVYPFAEAGAAVLMVAGVLPWLSGPVALFIGTVGAASVIKAVWIDGRELECACVGGGSSVPLGFISLTENLAMIAMGIWTLARAIAG